MKVSTSIEWVWQMAAQESIAAEHKEIEPEHFLAALLKFAELPAVEIENIAPDSEALKDVVADMNAVRQELEGQAIDTTRARRELRDKLGKGGSPYDGGQTHRSQAARILFDAAARLADDTGSDVFMAKHILLALLQSPTPLMTQVLGQCRGPALPEDRGPLGQDLNRLAMEGKLPPCPGREAECKALLWALGQRGKCCAVLVTDGDETARSVVVAAATVLASRQCPAALKGRRIMDATALKDGTDAEQQLGTLLAGAAATRELIFWLPAVPAQPPAVIERWIAQLNTALTKGCAYCIYRVSPAVFTARMDRDRTWQQLAQAIWIHDTPMGEVPGEL